MASKEYHRQYNLERYHRIRSEYVEKLGGHCVDCATIDELEFDHVDPSTKEFDIGKLLNYAKAVRDAEIEKCELRCKPCHQKKTSVNGDIPAVHHGGGLTGKRNCYCALCKPLKLAYNKSRLVNSVGRVPYL